MTNHPNRNWRTGMCAGGYHYAGRVLAEHAPALGLSDELHDRVLNLLADAYMAGAEAEHARMIRCDRRRRHDAR